MSHRQELKGALIALVTILGLTLLFVLLLPDPSGDYSRLGTPRSSGDAEPGYPMKFSVGSLDPRFGITRARFLKLIGEAGSVWERPVGLELFRYDSSAPFRIEMVFDARQQRRIEERMMRGKISLTGKSFDNLRDEYDSKVVVVKELESKYSGDLSACEQKVEAHNRKVARWNESGGAPKEVYSELNAEEVELNKFHANLERERIALNVAISEATALSDAINKLVTQYNLQIENYNGRFVSVREFEKGQFNGSEINIYEYEEEVDLRAALAHELGHALGFGHVEDSTSIMFYKLEKQDLAHLSLKAGDMRLLEDKFPGAHLSLPRAASQTGK
ncbi:MAG TPA: matrixin family metalloprotease [Bacteroidota bacterium]